jgi:hypothetical protein
MDNPFMQFVNVGSYYCKFCKKNIPTRVYTGNPDLVLEYKDNALSWANNYHWYDNHYNCASCGKWITSGERELITEKEFKQTINQSYNWDNRTGLLRIHKKCLDDIGGQR